MFTIFNLKKEPLSVEVTILNIGADSVRLKMSIYRGNKLIRQDFQHRMIRKGETINFDETMVET